MSLINDALKKAETQLKKSQSVSDLAKQAEHTNFESLQSHQKKFFAYFIGGTAILTAIILGFVFLKSRSFSPYSSISYTQPNTRHNETLSLASAYPDPEIALNSSEEAVSSAQILSQRLTQALKQSSNLYAYNQVPSKNIDPTATASIEKDSKNATSKKDINQEMIEGIVSMASKVLNPSSKEKDMKNPEQNIQEGHKKEWYTVSEAQETEEISGREQKKHIVPKDPAQDYIDKLNIMGILISNNESKVLMNNQIYTINSNINPDLKLIEIHPNHLVFTNENGTRYLKEF